MGRLLSSGLLVIGLLSACTTRAIPTSETPTPIGPRSTPTPEVTPTPAETPMMTGFAMFEDGGWGWDADRGKLYRSTDGGQTWGAVSLPEKRQFNFPASAFLDIYTAWVASADPLTAGQRLLFTPDGGATWIEMNPEGLENMAGDFRYHFINRSEGWAETSEAGAGNIYIRVFQTPDGGASYDAVPILPLHFEEGLPEGTVHLCSICADTFHYDPERIVVINGDIGSMEPRGAVRGNISLDHGKTWKELSLPLPEKYRDALVWPLEASFVSDMDGFLPVVLVKYNPDGSPVYRILALYASRDGGATWELAPGLVPQIPNFPVPQFLNSQEAIIECGQAICLTHDGGKTWQTIPLDPSMVPNDARSITAIQFINPLVGWMIIADSSAGSTTYRTYKTTDGAANWMLQ